MISVLGLSHETGKPVVTLKNDNPNFNLSIEELKAADVRTMAVKHASEQGILNARPEMSEAPYACDKQGDYVDKPHTQKIDHYRVDIPICRGM